MINGGNATVFVTDMQRAVDFYTETLGLKLQFRAGDHWAAIDAGDGFVIGLHPASPAEPAPGTRGAVQIGLTVVGSLDDVVGSLQDRGVEFLGAINDDGAVRLVFLNDPDGNKLYLCEINESPAPS